MNYSKTLEKWIWTWASLGACGPFAGWIAYQFLAPEEQTSMVGFAFALSWIAFCVVQVVRNYKKLKEFA